MRRLRCLLLRHDWSPWRTPQVPCPVCGATDHQLRWCRQCDAGQARPRDPDKKKKKKKES